MCYCAALVAYSINNNNYFFALLLSKLPISFSVEVLELESRARLSDNVNTDGG